MIACLLVENLKAQLKQIQEILTEEAGCLRCEIKSNCIYLNLGVSEITDEADDFIRHLRAELKGICPDIRVGVASSRFASLAAAQKRNPGCGVCRFIGGDAGVYGKSERLASAA